MKNISIIGLWHQGVVGAACMAKVGYTVLGADKDQKKIESLSKGKAPIYEPGLDELLQAVLSAKTLSFTTDFKQAASSADEIMIMFDTKVDADDQLDMTEIFDAIKEITPKLRENVILYVTSQIPVGTCDRFSELIKSIRPSLEFSIAYSPENLRLGQAIDRFLHPALPVVGANDPETIERMKKLLAPLCPEWKTTNLRTAEMVKHALNAYIGLTVCFGNEIGSICDEVGADGHKIAEVLRLEERIGKKAMLAPGLGFSGGTLARDMQTLRNLGDQYKLDTILLDGAWNANKSQNQLVVRRLSSIYGKLKGIEIAVFGLTYKPDTSTLRRSAAIEITQDLAKAGARISAHDPKADRTELATYTHFAFHEDPYKACENAQVLLMITAWKDYKEMDFDLIKKKMKANPLVFDTANIWKPDLLESRGFFYINIGSGRKPGGAQ
jgi:UDPglucose 6-dehydrogenase